MLFWLKQTFANVFKSLTAQKATIRDKCVSWICFGKQFVSRKVLKKELKFLSAWFPLSASARTSVLHASPSSEETGLWGRGNQDGRKAWQHFGREELVSNQFQSDTNMIIYSIQQCSNIPQAKIFACPEGYFCRELKREKRKLQF